MARLRREGELHELWTRGIRTVNPSRHLNVNSSCERVDATVTAGLLSARSSRRATRSSFESSAISHRRKEDGAERFLRIAYKDSIFEHREGAR